MNGSKNSRPTLCVSAMRAAACSMLSAVALIMTLTVILLVSGCCGAATVQDRPLLPAGKPKQETSEQIAHELLRFHSPGASGVRGPKPWSALAAGGSEAAWH